MKEFLESLEIGEGKVKLSNEEIKKILTEHGKTVTTETEKVKTEFTKELTTYKDQLKTANEEIKSYKEMDIDSIKKSASDWETKYKKLEESQKAEKEKKIREERTNDFFKEVTFSSEMAKAGVISKFNEKDFKYDEESKSFQGAKEWLEDLKKNDANSFKSEVANPSFSATPQAPKTDNSMDDIMRIMGLNKEK